MAFPDWDTPLSKQDVSPRELVLAMNEINSLPAAALAGAPNKGPVASNPPSVSSSLPGVRLTETIIVRGPTTGAFYKEYPVVADHVTDNSAVVNTAYADAITNNASVFLPAAILAVAGAGVSWNGQINVFGCGKNATRFWALTQDMAIITLGNGCQNSHMDGFSVDGRGLAGWGFKVSGGSGAGTLIHMSNVEIIGITGTPGNGIESVATALNTALFTDVKINNNKKGLVLPSTGGPGNTNANLFVHCNFSHNTLGNVILGDDAGIMSAVTFDGCVFQHDSPDPAQANIYVDGVQCLTLINPYFEAAQTGGHDIRITGTLASVVVMQGYYGAGGTLATNPILIDVGVPASTLIIDGYQVNGYLGALVLDNSGNARIWKSPGIEQGSFIEGTYSKGWTFSGNLTTPKVLGTPNDVIIASGSANGDVRFAINSNTAAMTITRFGQLVAAFAGTPVVLSSLGTNVTSGTPAGNDRTGTITIVVSGAVAVGAVIGTFTFKNAYAATPKTVQLTPAAAANPTFGGFMYDSLGTSSFVLRNGAVAMAAGTYVVAYTVEG